MISLRKFVGFCPLLLLLGLQGCSSTKKTGLPHPAPAPTVAVVLPDEIPPTEAPEESPPKVPSDKEKPEEAATKPGKPKKPARNSSSAKKSNQTAGAPSSNQNSNTPTVAAAHPPKNPADSVPQAAIAAAVSDAKINQTREETSRIVDATENALKGLTRSLTDDEKSMKTQVQSYLQQSRKATTDGDYERANLLAKKAQLLAEALLKK
jgi:hypothetical protein